MLGALSVVVLGVLVFGLGVRRNHEPSLASPAVASPLVVQAARSSTPLPAEVDLTIDVQPRDAAVFLDGDRLLGDPPAVKVQRGSSHVVRAEADGYVTATREVTSFENTTVDLSLQRVEPVRAVTPVVTESNQPRHTEPKKPGPQRSKRPLDETDPWAP